MSIGLLRLLKAGDSSRVNSRLLFMPRLNRFNSSGIDADTSNRPLISVLKWATY